MLVELWHITDSKPCWEPDIFLSWSFGFPRGKRAKTFTLIKKVSRDIQSDSWHFDRDDSFKWSLSEYKSLCDGVFITSYIHLPSFETATDPKTMRSTFTLASRPTGLPHCSEPCWEAATLNSCFEASEGGTTCRSNPERRLGIGTNKFFLA